MSYLFKLTVHPFKPNELIIRQSFKAVFHFFLSFIEFSWLFSYLLTVGEIKLKY